jgi:hypothetical protein
VLELLSISFLNLNFIYDKVYRMQNLLMWMDSIVEGTVNSHGSQNVLGVLTWIGGY